MVARRLSGTCHDHPEGEGGQVNLLKSALFGILGIWLFIGVGYLLCLLVGAVSARFGEGYGLIVFFSGTGALGGLFAYGRASDEEAP